MLKYINEMVKKIFLAMVYNVHDYMMFIDIMYLFVTDFFEDSQWKTNI